MFRFLAVALVLLTGCDFFPLPDDEGDPILVASDAGRLLRLSVTEESRTVTWSAAIESSNRVALEVDGPDLYVASGGTVQAFDLGSGTENWAAEVAQGDDVIDIAGPAGGQLYALTFNVLVALDPSSGAELWRRDLSEQLETWDRVAASGAGILLAGSNLSAVSASDGEELGALSIDELTADVDFVGSTAIVGAVEGVLGIDPSDASERWRVPLPSDVTHIDVAGDVVAFAVFAGGLGLADGSGSLLQRTADTESWQGVSLGDDSLVAARSDGQLVSLATADFTEQWSVAADAANTTVADMARNGSSVFVALGGVLESVDALSGDRLWTYQTDGEVVRLLAL